MVKLQKYYSNCQDGGSHLNTAKLKVLLLLITNVFFFFYMQGQVAIGHFCYVLFYRLRLPRPISMHRFTEWQEVLEAG